MKKLLAIVLMLVTPLGSAQWGGLYTNKSAGGAAGSGDALTTNGLSQFAPTTSAELRGVLSDETGTGAAVFANGALGTPTSVVLTNATGTAASLTAGLATALAADPADCAANNFAISINASGTLGCAQPSISAGISGLGANVATALGVAVGSAGAPVVFDGAGGTPSSLTLTNATGLPVAGGGTGIATTTAYSPVFSGTSATGAWSATIGPGTATQVLTSNGAGAYPSWQAAAGGGGAALSGITAATAANTLTNGNNTGQVWNWANTANTTVALTLGETTAATNGTSTSGVPNQVGLKLTTLATSTQSPLSVYSRAAHVFSVSPSATQVLYAAGSVTVPVISFADQVNLGFYRPGSNAIGITSTSDQFVEFNSGNDGQILIGKNGGAPSTSGVMYASRRATSTGMNVGDIADDYWVSFIHSNAESVRFTAYNGGQSRFSTGSSDAVGFTADFRKARTSVASPSVITSGDDLATLNGYGYVGAVGYRKATAIRFDSTGTISNATNGIGGEIVFGTMKQGVDTAAVDRFKIDQHGHPIAIVGTANTPTMGACGTTPSVAGTDDTMLVTVGTGGADTACVINFGTTWVATAVVCSAINNTDIVAYKASATTSALTITATAAFTAGSKFAVMCRGY